MKEAKTPKTPRAGTTAWYEARAKDPVHAKEMVLEILRCSRQAKPETLKSLEGWLTRCPELRPLVTQHFDLCTRTEAVWIGRLASGNLIAAQTIKQEIETLKQTLMSEAPSALERILVSTVAVTYMAQQLGAMTAAQKTTVTEMAAIDRHAENVQKRLFQAVEFLAFLREQTTAEKAAHPREPKTVDAKPPSRPSRTGRPKPPTRRKPPPGSPRRGLSP